MELSAKDNATFCSYLARTGLDEKPHQLEGVAWALDQEREGKVVEAGEKHTVVRGGLLADEMGLGKTTVMIGTMVCNPLQRTLIVVPRALVEQWHRAILQTTGHDALIFHGSSRFEYSPEEISARHIVITTYNLIATEKKEKQGGKEKRGGKETQEKKGGVIHQIEWSRLIFDEAHHLRNDNTAIFSGAFKLKADVRWLVTGTPIQNRKKDFYSLCAQMGLPSSYYGDSDNLLLLVRSFIMKRTASQADIVLPELLRETCVVGWESEEEKHLAENFHALLNFSKVNKKYADNCIAQLDLSSLTLLVRSRQLCVLPRLVKHSLQYYSDAGLIAGDATNGVCGTSKLNAVVEKIVSRAPTGNSKLVFCHFRGEIDYIKERLEREGMDVETFDGRVKESERVRILEGTCDVLILQIQTGCEGLNLQQFNEVYFVSPHWNPAVEDQAVARCHRIGQEEEVHVFRFTMDAFDEDGQTISLDKYSSEVQEVKRGIMNILEVESEEEDGGQSE
jgi:SNF2 family DNA or RNA helicase